MSSRVGLPMIDDGHFETISAMTTAAVVAAAPAAWEVCCRCHDTCYGPATFEKNAENICHLEPTTLNPEHPEPCAQDCSCTGSVSQSRLTATLGVKQL